MPENSPQSLGRYTIHAELGKGGFATVYRATDTTLERDVALKILKPGWTDDAKAVERFMREAKQASRLKHADIVTIYDVGQAEGRLFIAMELVRGRSLQQIITDDGAMAWPRLLAILEQSAAALDYAHKQGLIHRDIKPANIILDESEPGDSVHAILTDFGLVRGAEQASLSVGSTGGMLGTPEYLAPEIWDGEPATKGSDIYALGCVAFFLITGKILFGATTPVAVLKRHVEGPIFPQQWPSGVPAEAEAVLRRALAKDPAQRPTSAAGFVAELRACEKQAAGEQAAREQEAKQKEEAERAAQAALALAAARKVEQERARQEAERRAKEEAARLAEEEARRKQIEQQSQAPPASEITTDKSVRREADVIDRKRFLWLSVAGGVTGWGLGWLILIGAANGSSSSSSVIPIFILAGLCAGIIPSSAQWLMLRHVASAWKWIIASVVGLGVGGGLGVLILWGRSDTTPAGATAFVGALAGLGLGVGQWLVLRRQMSNFPWWLVANASALALGLTVAFSITLSLSSNEILGGVIVLTLGCALQSVVAGWLLPRLITPTAQ
jgi:hypothetical protein